MSARPLGQDEYARENERRYHRRCEWTTERQAAVAYGLIQKVADCSTERPRKDEGAPEEEHARDVRPQVKSGKSGQPCSEDKRTSLIAEAAGIGNPITERGAECL